MRRIYNDDIDNIESKINAAIFRLKSITVSDIRTRHAVEKEEVLNLLNEALELIPIDKNPPFNYSCVG